GGPDRLDRALGEGAVADVTPRRRAEASHLSHRERREVVVEQEVAVRLALQRLDLLLVVLSAQRGRYERLRLATGEQRRAVRPRQVSGLDRDRPDLVRLAAVQPEILLDDHPAQLGRLRGLE